MKRTSLLYRFFNLYYDGFKGMTLGKTLWLIILIKLFIMFFILKLFFFPNYVKNNSTKGKEADFIEKQIMKRT